MTKFAHREPGQPLPGKVKQLFLGVISLVEEGVDIAGVSVSELTEKAGIGKGTAYEYFDSKEEMIAYALNYWMEDTLNQVREAMEQKEGFFVRVSFLMEAMEGKEDSRSCLFKFATLFFDTSEIGEMLRNLLEGRKDKCSPATLVDTLVGYGIERGEVRTDCTREYLNFSLISRLVTFLSYRICKENKSPEEQNAFFREVYQGIVREFALS